MVTWNGSCAATQAQDHANNLYRNVSAHQVFIWISVVCTIIVCISMAGLAASHAFNYTIPREQRLLLRVIALPPVYAICNLIGTIIYPTDVYLEEVPNIVEAFGLAAVFELYVYYLTPGATISQRDRYFEDLERVHVRSPLLCCGSNRNTSRKHDQGSLRWYKVSGALVFQYIPMSCILAILKWIAAAKFCPYDKKIQVATIVLALATVFFITFSIAAILRFESRLREPLKSLGAGRKLWGLKLFVGTSVTIKILVAILQKIEHYTPRLTYYDFSVGVPNVLFEFAMLIFCAVFWWAYPVTRYRRAVTVPDATGATIPRQPAYRAIIDSLNIWDALKGTGYGLKVLVLLPFGKKMLPYHTSGEKAEFSPEGKPGLPMEEVDHPQV